jgi:hypothetical protein
MDLKEQRDTIEENFKKCIEILENGSDNYVYGLTIPMFEDVMKGELYTERNVLIQAIKEFYSDMIIDEEVICERGFIGAYIKTLKKENHELIFKYQIMAFLFGFLDTSLIRKEKEKVVKNDIEKQKKKNKKKREQKKRNKWKKPPSPSLDYKTYDWNIPSIPPPQYVF